MALLDSLHINPATFRKWMHNVLSSYADVAVGGGVFFLLTPIIVRDLGVQKYSLWLLCHTITFYLGFFDLGLGQAQVRYLAKFHALRREDHIQRLLGTTLCALFCAGALAALCAGSIALGSSLQVLHIADEWRREFAAVMGLLAVNLLITFPAAAFTNVLYGTQRFDLANARSIATRMIAALAQYLALRRGHGIVVLALIELGVSALRMLLDVLAVRRLHPEWISHLRFGFHSSMWRRVKRFARWAWVEDLVVEGTAQLDRLFIAMLLPLGMLAPYAISKSVGGMVALAIEPMTQTFYPLAAELHARGKREELLKLLLAGSKSATAVAMPLAIVLGCFGERIIGIWVPELATTIPQLLIPLIAINMMVTVFLWTSTAMLMAMNGMRQVALLTLLEVAVACAAIALLTRRYELAGIAMGSLVANIAIGAFIQLPMMCRRMNISTMGFVGATLVRVTLAAMPSLALAWWLSSVAIGGWLELAGTALLVLTLYIPGFVFIALSATERSQYLRMLCGYMRPERRDDSSALDSRTP